MGASVRLVFPGEHAGEVHLDASPGRRPVVPRGWPANSSSARAIWPAGSLVARTNSTDDVSSPRRAVADEAVADAVLLEVGDQPGAGGTTTCPPPLAMQDHQP